MLALRQEQSGNGVKDLFSLTAQVEAILWLILFQSNNLGIDKLLVMI